MSVKIQFRRDTAARWAEVNPVLARGEPGMEIETARFKLGDGVARWLDLNYFHSSDPADIPVTVEELEDHINSTTPHPVYDNGPSLNLLYQNAKV